MSTIATRRHLVALARIAAALTWAGSAGPAAAQQYAPPPSTSIVCPAIDEDGMLCSADFMSGNCDDFVSAADRLGALYRSELKKLPGSEGSLKTTIWWGCGPGNLQNIKTLLTQIGTAHALAVLQTDPYRSPPVLLPPPPSPSAPQPQCEDLPNPIERNLCIGAQLQAARADHKRAFERCDARADGSNAQSLQTFVRSRCLAEALAGDTRGMLAAHPECAAPN